MTISLKHAKTSTISDNAGEAAAGEIVPSDWNAQHLLTQASGTLLGRTTAGSGSTEEVTPSSAFSFSSDILDLANTITAAGPIGSATVTPIITFDAKGRLTSVTSATVTPAASSITGTGDLTKVDDTNVTLTLGGTPTGSLLKATSITVGWTGTLALSRLAQGTDGQLIVGQTSAAPAYKTVSGDGTLSAAGALSVTKTSGVAFGTAATLNVGTSANNIVQLDGSSKLPAVDASQLTHLTTVPGVVSLSYVNGAWVARDPNGGAISTGSTTTSGLQEAINYAQTNGYDLLVYGPNTTSAGAYPAKLTCTTSITIGPATFKKYEINAQIDFGTFSGNAFIIDTLSNCELRVTAPITRSGGGSSDVTLYIHPHTVDPVFSSKSFQQNKISFNGIKLTGASATNSAVVDIDPSTAGYQIVNNGEMFFGSVDAGSGYATTALRIEMPATGSGCGFGDNRITWSLLVGFASYGLLNGASARASDVAFNANCFAGSIENNQTGATAHISSNSRFDTYLITSMDLDAGTCTNGFLFNSGADHNFFICPEIIATTNSVNDSGSQNRGFYSDGTTSIVYMPGLPTSSTGLPTGAFWNSTGVVHVV